MKYLLIENEEGQYIKINGTERYDILECHEVVGPRADDFQEFDNIEQAMEAYEVEFYHEPVPEEPEQEEVIQTPKPEVTGWQDVEGAGDPPQPEIIEEEPEEESEVEDDEQ